MDPPPHDWLALAALVFLLGLKHGLDADHLTAIDGLTRFNAREQPRLARWCGTLFSIGHGAVVVVVALFVSTVATRWQVPAWLDHLGNWVSIGLLTALGLLNLHAVISAPRDDIVRTLGFKGSLFGRLQRTSSPLLIGVVGALFAASFDTISQAALFALTATQFGGAAHALAIGFVFMLGMLLVDGLNGMWIARLIRRADRTARVASRVMGLAVAGLSLAIAGWAALRYLAPRLAAGGDDSALAAGLAVISVVGASFVVAMVIARTAGSRSAAPAHRS